MTFSLFALWAKVTPARILRNPYHAPVAKVCKVATIAPTMLWSVMVLCKHDAFAPTAYAQLARYMHEDVIAGAILALSSLQLYWLWAWCKPFRFCALGYGALWAWWTAVLVFVVLTPGPLQITVITGVSLLVALAAIAFVSGPRRGVNGGAA